MSKLQFPLEIHDATKLKGAVRPIKSFSLLFPSYVPKVSKDSPFYQHIQHLSRDNPHVKATIICYGNSSIYGVATPDLHTAYNHFYFPRYSDEQVVSYLHKNQGWTPKLLHRIKSSQEYLKCREDLAQNLYVWEHSEVKSVPINFRLASDIIEKEFQLHAIPYDYSISRITSKSKLGHCEVKRSSGWVARPSSIDIGFVQERPSLHIVLHELAHAFDAHYYRTQNHGPTFMLLYRDLLFKYLNIDYLQSMIKHGLYRGKYGNS